MTDDAPTDDTSEAAPDPETADSASEADAVTSEANETTDEAATAASVARRLRAGEELSVVDLRDRDTFERWGIDGRTVRVEQVPHVRFVASHATGDVRDPLPELPEPILVVCARGEASDQVAGWLREAGVDARNLAGGTRAWAETILTADLETDGETLVRQYQRPATGCLSYLVANGDEAVVIDPLRAATDRYVADAETLGVTVEAAVDTHVHADHVSGVRALADRVGAATVLPAGARDRGLGFDPTRVVTGGDRVAVGDTSLEVVDAPGHTRESVAFHGENVLFAGDTLFLQSVGRPDLVDADDPRSLAEAAHRTLHDRLLAFSDDTILAPGHAADPADAVDGRYAAPLRAIRDLPVLGLDRAAFVERVTERLPPKPANHAKIVATNLGRESMSDDAAFEAELGPNHCAVTAD